uniref:G_PROTEIN_RECEP_F1_2 domain-containing protein n=1 Tax=Steinernema glaseri TaxID=37863 RepID=A0A1I7YGS9_9BILA
MSPLRLALLLLVCAQLALADFHLFERSCREAKKAHGGCHCIVHVKMTKCCCIGAQVREMPRNLTKSLTMLFLHDVSVTTIGKHDLERYRGLVELAISESSIQEVDASAFDGMKFLMKISIVKCPRLTSVNGTFLKTTPRLQSIMIKYNGLERLPRFEMLPEHPGTVDLIDFSHNKIEYIERGLMVGVKAKTVRFNDNHLQEVSDHVFVGCQFISLFLNDNAELTMISEQAFTGLEEIHQLNISNTAITTLPHDGLTQSLETIIIRKTHNLKKLPTVLRFTNLVEAQFTYPYHCCLFKHAGRELGKQGYVNNHKGVETKSCVRRKVEQKKVLKRRRRQAPTTESPAVHRFGDDVFLNNIADWVMDMMELQDNMTIIDDEEEEEVYEVGAVEILEECQSVDFTNVFYNVTCSPEPDDLNPCEDIVGYPWLRGVIWIMWTVGVVMNIVVLSFLWNIKQRNLRLHYFFMMNLSFADLLTGIYLAMLAFQDLNTRTEYYNYAVEWQTGWGCWIAGFISVLASELSIISMLLLAFEMWYNAKFAFFGKKMGPKLAYGLMMGGYVFSFGMAVGPWFGVSSYETSSICLPLSIEDVFDQSYLVIGLVFNLMCFCGVILCYIMICFMLCNPNTPSREEDTHIILKLAILIFTDMACWMPTLFFGLTAAFNHPLISLTNAKVFLIVFHPINSLCNPVLYCLATKVAKNKVQTKIKKFKQLQIHRSSVDWLKSFGSERHLPKLNHFYHSNPPSERSSVPNGYDPSVKLLSIIGPNSMDNTPRGSSGSITARSPEPEDHEEVDRPKRNSVVSFYETVLVHSDHNVFAKRKSMGSIRQKVSAIPEMSDISENISENSSVSQPNTVPNDSKRKSTRRASLQLVSKFIRSRRSKNPSIGADSGRGSSVTSTNSLLRDRVSLTSTDSCFTNERSSFELTSMGSSSSDTSPASPPKVRSPRTPKFVITDHSQEVEMQLNS